MYVYYGARIALHGVHLDDNSTQYNGSTDYCAYGGGGIFLDAYDYATSIVIDHGSSVSRNTTGGIVAYGNYGGALLKISNTTLSRNTGIGDYSGGAICAVAYNGGTSVHLDHATVDKNIDHGYWSSGGIMALANQEGGVDLTIKNSSITGNVSSGQYGTGGVTAFSYSYSNGARDMVGTTLSGNRAPNQGYGGALQLYGASSYSPIEAVLTKDTFLNNTAGTATDSKVGYGGAITAYYYITIDATAVTVTGNRALGTSASSAYGGGVYLYTYETSAWTNSTISKNRATGGSSYGGGVYSDGYDDLFAGSTIDHNQAAYGGGIYESSSGYTLRLNRSTVSNNRAGTAGTAGYGGGLYLSDTAMLATNSTFAGNAATGAGSYGGAIYDGSGSSLTLDFVTISGNAASLGGGIYDTGAGGSLRGSILGGNTKTLGGTGASNCVFTAPYAALSSVGHNVLSNGCVQAITFGDDIANPHLGSLASNGGPTKTMKPLAGSPALGNGGVSHPTTDQRGVKRHNVTDSGAFELT
jgi:hypothetical protein